MGETLKRIIFVNKEAAQTFTLFWHLVTYFLTVIFVFFVADLLSPWMQFGEWLFLGLIYHLATFLIHFPLATLAGFFARRQGFFGVLSIVGIGASCWFLADMTVYILDGYPPDLIVSDAFYSGLILGAPFSAIYWLIAFWLKPKAFLTEESSGSEKPKKTFLTAPANAYSGVIRPPVPITSGHPFRFDPAGDSGASGHP